MDQEILHRCQLDEKFVLTNHRDASGPMSGHSQGWHMDKDDVFRSAGALREDYARIDWAATPVGSPSGWSRSLRAAVSICLINTLPSVIAWGPELTLLYNEAFAAMIFSKHPGALGASHPKVFWESWDKVGPELHGVIDSGRGRTYCDVPMKMLRRGQMEDCHFTFGRSPLRDDDGGVVGVFSVILETTERVKEMRRHEQEATERSDQAFRELFTAVPDAIVVAGAEGLIVMANQEAERLFGYAAGALLGEPLETLLPEARGVAGESAHPPDVLNVLHFARRRDGSEFPVRVTPAPVTLREQAATLVTVRDISEWRALEASLLRAQERSRQTQKMEAIGRLASGVAHDFNNLLSIILGSATLALDDLPAEAPQRGDVEQIILAAERATALTKQLLTFSRQQVQQTKVLDLALTLTVIAPMIRRLLGEDVELVLESSTNHGLVRADPGQIEQVIMNLAVNARDAMPVGGVLTFSIAGVDVDPTGASPGPFVRLSVADTGEGMDRERQARIFEPFFTTKAAGQGTGLGLATVHGIVQQSGGSIAVSSELGQGTTFTIHLPRVEQGPDIAPAPAAPASVSLRQTGMLLLVEDEAPLRALAAKVLRGVGYEVLVAGGAIEALELAAAHAGVIDLLVTDIVMPGQNGRLLADALGGARPGLKVLFMSGHTDDVILRHGIEHEKVAFLQKPFTPERLLAHVQAALSGARA
jgi:two-component system cell cycle sensor histidine kinase/response regulator CckA